MDRLDLNGMNKLNSMNKLIASYLLFWEIFFALY